MIGLCLVTLSYNLMTPFLLVEYGLIRKVALKSHGYLGLNLPDGNFFCIRGDLLRVGEE